MKSLVYLSVLVIALLMLVISCGKSLDAPSKPKEPSKKWYRIAAIGKETVYSPVANARGESYIIMSESQNLRLELISYHAGVYTIKATNKQNCHQHLEWMYTGLTINSNTVVGNDRGLEPNSSRVFTLTGSGNRTGTIKARPNSVCNGGSPSWVTLNITMDILPVKFISFTARRDRTKDYDLFLDFTIETPEDADTFEIQESENGKDYHTIHSFVSDKKTKVYSIRIPNTNF